MTDDLVKRLRYQQEWGSIAAGDAADRIEKLEAALREKENIAYIIDGHGISHNTFTIVYGENKND